MGTKNNPGDFDCYANADPDEPMFVLLGRDPFAPDLVDTWADLREAAGDDPRKVQEARQCAEAMRHELSTRGRRTPPSCIAISTHDVPSLDTLKGRP